MKGSEGYFLYHFSENHNHDMVSSDNMDLTRKARHLTFDDVNFIHTMSMHRVGPTAAHRLQSALKGGHHTRNSFKTVSREIRMFIGDRDVKLVLQMLQDRASNLQNFSYEYLHDGSELKAIFWADDVSKVGYHNFGDVIAFDATYQTNK
jgi:hypothetical protein